MKSALVFILLLTFSGITHAQLSVSGSFTIEDILQEVNEDSLVHFVKELTGEVPVFGTDTIFSRHRYRYGNIIAGEYLYLKLESYQLDVGYNLFGDYGMNVFGEQTGTVFPDKKFIICAHYDDAPNGPIAPGADDNASGAAAVVEAARIFRNYSFPYTIVYALWDEEESGRTGSKYYASLAASSGDNILGVINLDMISYDSNNDNKCAIMFSKISNSEELSLKMLEMNSLYNIELNPEKKLSDDKNSDHASFWECGYSAVWFAEYGFDDVNPYYHSVNDLLQYYNIPYYLKMVKLTYASLATCALNSIVSADPDPIVLSYTLKQNYPNPFNPVTTISYSVPAQDLITITIYDALGRTTAILLNESISAGNHQVIWNAENLPSGVYFCEMKSENFNDIKKLILLK